MDLSFIIFFGYGHYGYGHYSLVMDINLFKRSHLNQLAVVISDVLLLFFLHAWKLEFGTYLSSHWFSISMKKIVWKLSRYCLLHKCRCPAVLHKNSRVTLKKITDGSCNGSHILKTTSIKIDFRVSAFLGVPSALRTCGLPSKHCRHMPDNDLPAMLVDNADD